MQFYLKPENGAEVLFSVLDSNGQLVYEVTGACSSFGGRFAVRRLDGTAAAHLTGVNLPESFQYSAANEIRRIRIKIKPTATHRAVQIKGARWRFRGSILTRSFDIVEDQPHGSSMVIMTHSRCWSRHGDCYALNILRGSDVALAICVAIAVDCSIIGSCASPVPAG